MAHIGISATRRGLRNNKSQRGAAVKPVVIVAGPTASGKSACALAVAREFSGIVINADAMQLYAELAILTNRPGKSEIGAVPHRLFGTIPAAEPCSAGRWRGLAMAEIEAAAAAGRLPVVVGGTGLYLKALMSGLAAVPPVPAAVREEVRLLYKAVGREGLVAELEARDPDMGAAPRDKQRLLRAFEVLVATGRPLRAWQKKTKAAEKAQYRYAVVLLDPPRQELYAAIDRRFDQMMAAGALEEARNFASLGLSPDLPAMKAVGVRELLAHLRGETDLADAVAWAKRASRNYAKRQLTWFRHQLPAGLTLGAQYSESLSEEIFSFIRQFLLTPGARASSFR